MSNSSGSFSAGLLVQFILNTALVWVLINFFGDFFVLSNNTKSIIVVGLIFTILNLVARPILNLLTLPLRLFATVIAVVIVNGVFVYLTHRIVDILQLPDVTLSIQGEAVGFLTVALILGVGNWVVKAVMK